MSNDRVAYGGAWDPDEPPINDAEHAEKLLEDERSMETIHKDPGRRRIVVEPMADGGERITFVHEGAHDREYAAVALKYKDKMSDPSLPSEQRRTLSMQLMREVAAMKSAKEAEERAAAPAAAPPVALSPRPTVPIPKRTNVTFEFGPLGSHTAQYDTVRVSGNVVLLLTETGSPMGRYVPPPGTNVVIGIDGYPAPLPVILVGSIQDVNGYDQTVMLVIADDE